MTTMLKRAVKKSGLKLKYIAEFSEIPYNRLINIHVGRTKMSIDEAATLSKILNVPIYYFYSMIPGGEKL